MSVEKVKIFTMTDIAKNLEETINEWLSKNNNVIIVSRQVTSIALTGMRGMPVITFSVFIFYREK